MKHELPAGIGLSVPECWMLDNIVDDRPCVNLGARPWEVWTEDAFKRHDRAPGTVALARSAVRPVQAYPSTAGTETLFIN
jgi:hypothetical protein